MLRRSFWGLGGQAINSLSSLLFAVMVARVSTPAEVGAWAVCYALYTFILTVTRTTVSTTALISRPNTENRDLGAVDSGALTLCFTVGIASGLPLAVIGYFVDGVTGDFLVLFGVTMPILLLQDAIRYTFIRNRQTYLAALVDSVWLLFQVGVPLFFLSANLHAVGIGWCWALAALVSTVVGMLKIGPLLNGGSAIRFAKDYATIGSKLLVDSLINSATANLLPALLGISLGLSSTGYFRSGLTLLGVVAIFSAGLTPIATVEIVSRVQELKFVTRFLILWSLGFAVVGALLFTLFRILPDAVGVQLVGETWYGTYPILVPMALQVVLRGPISGVQIILRAAHHLNSSIQLRVIHGINVLCLTNIGALFWGLNGAAWAWMLSAVVGAIVALSFFRKSMNRL